MADPNTQTTTTPNTSTEFAGGVPPATNVIATATSGAPSPAIQPTGTTPQGTPQNATTPPSNPIIDDFDNYATGNEILDNATKSLGMLMGVSGAELAQLMSKALQHGDPSLLDGTLIDQKYPQYKEPLKQLTIAHIQQAQQHQKAVVDTAYGVAGSKENWDMAGVVLKDREILSTDGVMILAIGLDAFTKKIINGPDIQTRGLIYLRDAEYITSDVAQIMEKTIEEAVANKTYDNLTTRTEIRDKVSKYLFKQTAKRPMVLPVILEINTSNLG